MTLIQPSYGNLQKIVSDRVFRIPPYQRFYSWKKRQRDQLFGDIGKLVTLPSGSTHFMATIVCYQTNETHSSYGTEYRISDLVDGQQRITTLIILLKSIELAFPENHEFRKKINGILIKSDSQLLLLQSNNANEILFNNFVRHGKLPPKKELTTSSDENIYDAVKESQKFIGEWTQEDRTLENLFALIFNRLYFVVHDTQDEKSVYTVFEVLNSRGLAVDWLDKTKSMLMGIIFEKAQPSAAKERISLLQKMWAEIYLVLAKKETAGEEILRIMATLEYGPDGGKPKSAEDALEAIRTNCSDLEHPEFISSKILKFTESLTDLRENPYQDVITGVLQARILAVAIMTSSFSEKNKKILLNQWERSTFRIFGLCGKDARHQVGEYCRLAYDIANPKDDNSIQIIIDKIKNLASDSYNIDTAVNNCLQDKDIYQNAGTEVCRYILWEFEEHLKNTLGRNADLDEKQRDLIWNIPAQQTIEHIFPQNPAPNSDWYRKLKKWAERRKGKKRITTDDSGAVNHHLHRIGNLILLSDGVNKESSRKPFAKKKEVYEKSSLRMVKLISQEKEWDLKQIEMREKEIIEWAKTRWCDVDLPNDITQAD